MGPGELLVFLENFLVIVHILVVAGPWDELVKLAVLLSEALKGF